MGIPDVIHISQYIILTGGVRMTRQLALTYVPFLSPNLGICLHMRLFTNSVLFILCLNAAQLGQHNPVLSCCISTSPLISYKISVSMIIYYSLNGNWELLWSSSSFNSCLSALDEDWILRCLDTLRFSYQYISHFNLSNTMYIRHVFEVYHFFLIQLIQLMTRLAMSSASIFNKIYFLNLYKYFNY